MAHSMKSREKCPWDGAQTHFINKDMRCNCHPEGEKVECDGTEEKSYCLIGCEKCYVMIKDREAKRKQLDEGHKKVEEENKKLQEQLEGYKTVEEENKKLREQLEGYKTVEEENKKLREQLEGYKTVEEENKKLREQLEGYKTVEEENKKLREQFEAERSAHEAERLGRVKVEDELKTLLQEVEDAKKSNKKRRVDLGIQGHYSRVFRSRSIEVTTIHPSTGRIAATYHLHLDRLKQVSQYFDGWSLATAGDSTNEAKEIIFSDKRDHPEAFKYFVEFVYSGNYTIPESHDAVACLVHTLVYVLSDRLGSPQLKCLAMEKLMEYLNDEKSQPDDKVVIRMVEAAYSGISSNDSNATANEKPPPASTNGEDLSAEDWENESNAMHGGASQVGTDEESTFSTRSPLDEDLIDTLVSLDLVGGFEPSNEINSTLHPMRLLVSQYAASRLENLNKLAAFRNLLHDYPEFTVDMMIANGNLLKVPVDTKN